MTYATWDTETTTAASYKRKANPFDKNNYVVTHGWRHKGEEITEHRFTEREQGWLYPVLHNSKGERIKLLIGMNLKFDLLHALQDDTNLNLWMHYVAGGGQIWDIQLAEYLLCGMGQKDQMLSLDEIAPRYGGNVKIDEVKALWAAGVDTPDIDPELLTRYLCGGRDENGVWQKGDVENTEHVALAQIARARECGQLNSIMLNMGALIYTIEAERNGMYVDKPMGMEMAKELKAEVDALHAALNEYIPESPYRDQFSWASRFHKSALIFGGTINMDDYEYSMADGTSMLKTEYDSRIENPGAWPLRSTERLYAQQDELHYLLVDGTTVSCKSYDDWAFAAEQGAPDHPWPERVTFKAGKAAGEYKTKKVKVDNLDKPKGRGVKAPWTLPGFTRPSAAWKTSDPGVYSTSSEVIEELGNRDIPFLKALADLSKLVKDMGTYFYTVDENGKEGGMLTLVDKHGIIHHMLNMVATVTARLSSSNPNLQNIPKGNKSKVKLLFKSRFNDLETAAHAISCAVDDGFIKADTHEEQLKLVQAGGVLIQSDFSSLEVYVQAILTRCRQLIADLRAGLDMHVVRLASKEHMPYEEVYKLAKGYLDGDTQVPADKEWDYKRTKAKIFSFQRAYGAGVKKIASSTGMPEDEVQALADAEDARYPEIPAYYTGLTDTITAGAIPWRTTVHPEFPGVICHLKTSHYRTPDGKLYSYTMQPSPEYLVRRGVTASFSPTEIKNYVVQGAGGEWAKAAMYLTVRAFYERLNFGGLALLVNQVHDAEYCDAHKAVAKDAAALLHACMEAASDYMAWRFKWDIPLPVPSDTTWGATMMDEDAIPGLKELAAPLRIKLREQYMGGFTPSYLSVTGE